MTDRERKVLVVISDGGSNPRVLRQIANPSVAVRTCAHIAGDIRT